MTGRPAPEEEVAVRLDNGETAYMRALLPGDTQLMEAALERMSEASRYRRFMTGVSHLSDSELRYLTDVDGVDHAAFGCAVREDDGTEMGIGTARYVRSPTHPDEADFAVTVVDDHQRLGVATLLVDRLEEHAREHGIRRLTGAMLAENHAIRQFIEQRGGWIEQTDDPAVVHGFLALDR